MGRVTVGVPVRELRKDEKLVVRTEVRGSGIETEIPFTLIRGLRNPLLDDVSEGQLADRYPFLEVSGGRATVRPGSWSVPEPLVLPRGLPLKIEAGTRLRFCDDCYLIVKAPLTLRGEPERPIVLEPENQRWKGLFVFRAGSPSHLENAEIRGVAALDDSALRLTGGVTFYESDVDASNLRIRDGWGEDALNIVRSRFSLNRFEVRDTASDAFDSDFSNGRIEHATFERIGGDALDLSGSQVTGHTIDFDQIHDKAVSAGEASSLEVRNLRITAVGTGIVAKDASTVSVEDSAISDYRVYGAMAYTKKAFYGPASLSLEGVRIGGDTPFIAQEGNVLRANGRLVAPEKLDVEELYSEGPMRK
jgi:hypothetical protein